MAGIALKDQADLTSIMVPLEVLVLAGLTKRKIKEKKQESTVVVISTKTVCATETWLG